MFMIHHYQDVMSYIKNYKKQHGNQYQIPIFMNAKTTLVLIYGYRSIINYAINIHAVYKLVDKDGICDIYFEHTHIEIQKNCRYIQSSIQKGFQLHAKMMENIFI
jgi:uncharacterized protein YdeI (YjbR/CyaY-like superfamily)